APALKVQSPVARAVARSGRRLWRGATARWIHKESTDLEDDAVRAESPILPRYPLGRLLDFLELQRDTWPLLPLVECPALIIGSPREHVVDFKGVERLHQALPKSRLVVAQRGFHILPRDRDRALVCHEVCDFVDSL
ncbi:MAG: hypothetical protein JNG84_01245, partial [Archangium sp.]|nr:hypothetical protein [Archangium sp.]